MEINPLPLDIASIVVQYLRPQELFTFSHSVRIYIPNEVYERARQIIDQNHDITKSYLNACKYFMNIHPLLIHMSEEDYGPCISVQTCLHRFDLEISVPKRFGLMFLVEHYVEHRLSYEDLLKSYSKKQNLPRPWPDKGFGLNKNADELQKYIELVTKCNMDPFNFSGIDNNFWTLYNKVYKMLS